MQKAKKKEHGHPAFGVDHRRGKMPTLLEVNSLCWFLVTAAVADAVPTDLAA